MFTLKLFRRRNGQLVTKTISVHHVQTMEIGTRGKMIEVWAFQPSGDYDAYFIGDPDPGMDALNEDNHWGWGLLENEAGRTSEHYRPASYG